MAEQIPGFGFNPPFNNSFSSLESRENFNIANNITETLTISIPDNIQATLINYNVTITEHSSPAADNAEILVVLKYNSQIITSYKTSIPIVGNTTMVDNTYPSYINRLNKNDEVSMSVTVTGAGAGVVIFNLSLGLGGVYTA